MRRSRWLAVPVALGLLAPASAGAEAFKKGPYLQNVSSTAVTVMWEGDSAAPGRLVVRSVGEADRVIESPSALLHELRVDGLSAGRRYTYTVETAGASGSGEFATAPLAGEPFSFVVFGDSRSNADAHRALVERVRREVPDFILGTGDMVDDGSQDRHWQIFFTVERELLRDNVLFPAVGNHDRQGSRRTADTFRRYFSVPRESPDPERYYAFTYGNTRVLVLDSNAYSFSLTDQTAWLERELEAAALDPAIKHRFVVMHHPPFSVSVHGGQPQLREMWTPLFEKYGVDAVFSGHDHCYQRAEHNGIRYFVSGGGGAPLYPHDTRPAKEDTEAIIYFERTYHYLRVQVSGSFVEVAAVRDDGTLIESLSWGSLPERPVAAAPAAAAPAPITMAAPAPTPPSGCSASGGAGPGAAALWLAAACLALWRKRAAR
jgi:acid phosphatase type 7